MYRMLIMLLLVVLLLNVSGCSLLQRQKGEEQEQTRQEQTQKTDGKQESSGPGTVQVAPAIAGQQENPALSPGDQGEITAGIQETLTTTFETLRIKDLSKVDTLFYGLNEAGSTMTMEELQLQVETLQPMEWRLESSRAAGKDSRLVEITYTMPDGTVYQAEPFSMVDVAGVWMIHFNSFAASFNTMAGHLPGATAGEKQESNKTGLTAEKVF